MTQSPSSSLATETNLSESTCNGSSSNVSRSFTRLRTSEVHARETQPNPDIDPQPFDGIVRTSTSSSSYSPPAIEAITAPYAHLLDRVQARITDRYSSALPIIGTIADHHFRSGGKRIRPLLTLIVACLCEADLDRSCNLAACIELIHAASLMHDDVLDEAPFRRGTLSIREKWGNRTSILAGDYLFCQAFACMVKEGSAEVYRILSCAAAAITEGELHQMTMQRDLSCSLEDYDLMISKKTASLFVAACELPTALKKLSTGYTRPLAAFGASFGRLFQLRDDYLDYEGDEDVLGKKLGADLQEGKITFPVLYAYTNGDPTDKPFWHRLFSDGYTPNLQDFQRIKRIFAACNLKQGLTDVMTAEYMAGHSALTTLPQSEHRNTLGYLLDYIMYRQS